MTPEGPCGPTAGMANVLGEEKREQILALGRLGWSLRRIEREIHVRRETAGLYLHAAGIPVRRRGGLASSWPPWPAAGAKPATTGEVITDSLEAKPAITGQVITDSAVQKVSRAPTASACEPYRDLIEQGLRLGRNAMAIYQDLVDRPRLCGPLQQRAAIRDEAARPDGAGSAPGDRHGARARSAGGLRRRTDDSGRANREVPSLASLRLHAGLQPEVGSAADDGNPARTFGQSCTSERFAAWEARRRPSSSTTCAKGS